MHPNYNKSKTPVLAVFGVGMTVVAALMYPFLYITSEKVRTVTVESKERVVQGVGENMTSKYIVFSPQGEFEVTDTLLFMNWRSSSRYAALKEGQTCEVTTAGWRNGFLSMYPNIVKVGTCS